MRPARASNEFVTGELYRLRQPAKTLKALDEYEENYRRELHQAALLTGQVFKAWVYMYKQPRPEYCRVDSGEW